MEVLLPTSETVVEVDTDPLGMTVSKDAACEILTQEQVHSWREKGYCVIEPQDAGSMSKTGWLFSEMEAQRYRTAARVAVLGNGDDIKPLPDVKNFGGIGFPFLGRNSNPLNDLALHPRILGATRQLLNITVDDIPILSQAECWVKRDAGASPDLPSDYVNTDQRMHCDYPNHYLTHPPTWYQPEAVAMIVYLDDSAECGGETAYVPREGTEDEAYTFPYIGMPGVADMPWINDRKRAEHFLDKNFPDVFRFRQKLYAREQRVRYKVGTTLLYRLDLWHRGTPLTRDKDRAVVNLLYKRSEARHITSWHRGWATNAYNSWSTPRIHPPQVGKFEDMLSQLSPEQRAVLGFPMVGDSYWTSDTVRAVGMRYPGMDMRPYRAKL